MEGVDQRLPIEHDDAVAQPVAWVHARRNICTDDESPVERTTNAYADTLAKVSTCVLGKNCLRGLRHCVDCTSN